MSANSLIVLLSSAAITNFSKNAKKQEKEITLAIKAASDLLEGVMQDDAMVPVLKDHVGINLLKYASDIALSDAKGDTVQVATDIIHCIGERQLSEENYGGVVSTFADPKMYSNFLHIAFAILSKEELSEEGPREDATCDFTVHGMHILMMRLTQVLFWEGIACSSPGPAPTQGKADYFYAMRLAFSKGLMRAIISHGPSSTPTVEESEKEGGEMTAEEELELMLSPPFPRLAWPA